jgi:hypothetical protein
MSRTNSEVEGGPESLPAHSSASHAYTRGVEVLQANISGPGELSLWEFSGQESYFSLYDHFIGKSSPVKLSKILFYSLHIRKYQITFSNRKM